MIYFNRTVNTLLNQWVVLYYYYCNKIVMLCSKVSFRELLDCFDNDFENHFQNNAWNLELNAKELQKILNRIMYGIVNIANYLSSKITLVEQWHVNIQQKQRPILLYTFTDVQAHNFYMHKIAS